MPMSMACASVFSLSCVIRLAGALSSVISAARAPSWVTQPRVATPVSVRQLVTERNGGSDALRGCRASGMPGAPQITILDSAFWWEIDQAAHCCGRCEGVAPVDGGFKGAYLGSYG